MECSEASNLLCESEVALGIFAAAMFVAGFIGQMGILILGIRWLIRKRRESLRPPQAPPAPTEETPPQTPLSS